jgi:hypothetical protein
MSNIKVEVIPVGEAIKKISEVYAGREPDFNKDLSEAINAHQERTQIKQPEVSSSKKLKY